MSKFVVRKDVVYLACTNALQDVKEVREKEWNKAVEHEMNKKWFKAKTIEEAEKRLNGLTDHDFGDPPWKYKGWAREDWANDMISRLEITCSKNIILDSEDARIVASWVQ